MGRDYLNEFNTYLICEKGYSENTCMSYMRDLRRFSHFLSNSIECANDQQLQAYIDYLKKCGKSSATVARTIASLKAFYSYLLSASVIKENPAIGLVAERNQQKVPQILTSEEIEQLLDQPRCIDLKGYRDKAILEVLSATGIRVSELIELKVSDVNLQDGSIVCRGKLKERIIPLHSNAVKALSEYMLFIRKQLIRDLNEEVLFVNVTGSPMSRQGFWKLLKYYQRKAGIEKNITPHTLRHSFGAHMIQKGMGLISVQQIMGHSDISTTQIYSQIQELA